jgi:hypothetical protein
MSPYLNSQSKGNQNLGNGIWGYKIVLKSIKNYKRSGPIRFKMIVKE